MARFERLQRRLPGRLARVGHGREIDFVWNLKLPLALQSSPRYLFPCDDVIDEFPDAVRVRNRSGAGLFSRHAVEQFSQRRAVPRLTFLCAFELAVDAMRFGHCLILQVIAPMTSASRVSAEMIAPRRAAGAV